MKVFILLMLTFSACAARSLADNEEKLPAMDHSKHFARDCPTLSLRAVAEIHKDVHDLPKKNEPLQPKESEKAKSEKAPEAEKPASGQNLSEKVTGNITQELRQLIERAAESALNKTTTETPKTRREAEKLEPSSTIKPNNTSAEEQKKPQLESPSKKSRRSASYGNGNAFRAFEDDGLDENLFRSNFNYAVRNAPVLAEPAPAPLRSASYGGSSGFIREFDDVPAVSVKFGSDDFSSSSYGFREGKSFGGYGGAAAVRESGYGSAPLQREIIEIVKEVPVIKEVEVVREIEVPVVKEVIREVPVIQEVVKEVFVPAPAPGYGGPARAFPAPAIRSGSGYGRSFGFADAARSAPLLDDFSDLPESREFPVVRSSYDDAPIRVALEDDFRSSRYRRAAPALSNPSDKPSSTAEPTIPTKKEKEATSFAM